MENVLGRPGGLPTQLIGPCALTIVGKPTDATAAPAVAAIPLRIDRRETFFCSFLLLIPFSPFFRNEPALQFSNQ